MNPPKIVRPGESKIERFWMVMRNDADTGHRRYATKEDAMKAAIEMAEARQAPVYILETILCWTPTEPKIKVPLTAVDMTRLK